MRELVVFGSDTSAFDGCRNSGVTERFRKTRGL
jgi:hypothetical protein